MAWYSIPFARIFGLQPMKKFNAPFLEPMAPFFAGGAIVYWGIWKIQDKMMDSEEFRNDPRNPRAGKH